MTAAQKEQIIYMRSRSESYGAIADALHLPKHTVKSYCRRYDIVPITKHENKPSSVCDHCGQPLVQTPGAKQKRFCSKQCRMQWWYKHSDEMQRSIVYHFICPICGKEFISNNPKRVYCSRACFGIARTTARG